MESSNVVLSALVLVFGSLIQSAVGFAFGMFAIPLLILLGYQPFEAIAVIAMCAGIQTMVGSYWLRRHIDWKQVLGLIIISIFTVPIGVWTLDRLIAHFSSEGIKQIFGLLILIGLGTQVWSKTGRHDRLHTAWGLCAGAVAGFLGGVSGMGGPPMVMWVHAHNWTNERSRGTFLAYFAGLVPIQIAFLLWKFSDAAGSGEGGGPVGLFGHEGILANPVIAALLTAAVLSPVMILGIVPGLRIGQRIPRDLLRRISYGIVLVVSLVAIFEPMLHG